MRPRADGILPLEGKKHCASPLNFLRITTKAGGSSRERLKYWLIVAKPAPTENARSRALTIESYTPSREFQCRKVEFFLC